MHTDDLVTIHEAGSLMEANLLKDRLAEKGIKAFVDNTDSPLDGLTAAQQTQGVSVLPGDVDSAKVVVKAFVEHREAEDEDA